jgi:hypothetical protein
VAGSFIPRRVEIAKNGCRFILKPAEIAIYDERLSRDWRTVGRPPDATSSLRRSGQRQ